MFDTRYPWPLPKPGLYADYQSFARECIRLQNAHALAEQTLLSSNLYRSEYFDAKFGEAHINTWFPHMFGFLRPLLKNRLAVLIPDFPVISTREEERNVPSDGKWANLDECWKTYLTWLRDEMQMPELDPHRREPGRPQGHARQYARASPSVFSEILARLVSAQRLPLFMDALFRRPKMIFTRMSSSPSPITVRATCRVCGSRKLEPILSLGQQYAVGFLDRAEETAGAGPLDLVLCNLKDGGCGLLQLRHTYDHDLLYRKYWYKSGISTTMVKALADIVECAQKVAPLPPGALVIDIGANDGTLLRQYQRHDIQKVGFEPSNLWELAQQDHATIIHDYFNAVAFQKNLPGKKAKIITSISMFYDLEEPNSFVADIAQCLDADGLWIIQMNYLGLMLEDHTYDNISHEHLEYYSLLSLESLIRRHGLEIFDVELNDVNGGSYRLYIRKAGAQKLRCCQARRSG